MTTDALERARAGDERAFGEITGPYLAELRLHCYRILGSVQDAEDMLQETLLAAWRGLGQVRGPRRAAHLAVQDRDQPLSERAARQQPTPPARAARAAVRAAQSHPAGRTDLAPAVPGRPARRPARPRRDPDARYEAKETIALAFVAAVQHLPPRQRAVLVLRDALGFRSPEVADLLDSSEASVNSALQRARATMTALLPAVDRERAPLPRSAKERELAQRFAVAFASDDVDGVVALLTDDAWFSMPPANLEYQGATAIADFMAKSARHRGNRGTRLIPTRANGQPAFGRYVPDSQAEIFHLHSVVVLTMEGDRISAITNLHRRRRRAVLRTAAHATGLALG